MIEVVVTDEWVAWWDSLTEDEQVAVGRPIYLLEVHGVALGDPYSSSIKGSSFALRELRTKYQGRPFRVFYAFDPKRQAVLLIGGDKTGRDRFYDEMVPVAETIWREYLREQQGVD